LRRNCLLKRVIEGQIVWRIYVTVGQGRRREQLLDELKEMRQYWKLKEETEEDSLRKRLLTCRKTYYRIYLFMVAYG
jgi:hypothetical protein